MTTQEIANRCLNPITETDIEEMDVNEVGNLLSAIRIAAGDNPVDSDEHLSGLHKVAKQRMKILVLQNPPKQRRAEILDDSRLEGLLDPPEKVRPRNKMSAKMRKKIVDEMTKSLVSNKDLANRF